MDRLNDELMPISEDEWNEGGTEIHSQLRLAIMDVLNSTTNAYEIGELMKMLSQPDVGLPDEFKDGLRVYSSGRPIHEPPYQERILNDTLDGLVNDGKIQIKFITDDEGHPVKYYKAK